MLALLAYLFNRSLLSMNKIFFLKMNCCLTLTANDLLLMKTARAQLLCFPSVSHLLSLKCHTLMSLKKVKGHGENFVLSSSPFTSLIYLLIYKAIFTVNIFRKYEYKILFPPTTSNIQYTVFYTLWICCFVFL